MNEHKHFFSSCDLLTKGILFFCLDLTVNGINLTPDWFGWICMIRIFDRFGDENEECRSFGRFAPWLAICNGILWVMGLLDIAWDNRLLSAVYTVLTVWIIFRTIHILIYYAERRGVSHRKSLRQAVHGFAVLHTARWLLVWLVIGKNSMEVDRAISIGILLLTFLNGLYLAFGLSAMRHETEGVMREELYTQTFTE